METCNTSCSKTNILSFKSYYVVWKLEYFVDKNKYIYGFKSYYVVWKPYEVTTADDGRYHRLNRTM